MFFVCIKYTRKFGCLSCVSSLGACKKRPETFDVLGGLCRPLGHTFANNKIWKKTRILSKDEFKDLLCQTKNWLNIILSFLEEKVLNKSLLSAEFNWPSESQSLRHMGIDCKLREKCLLDVEFFQQQYMGCGSVLFVVYASHGSFFRFAENSLCTFKKMKQS